MLVFLEGKGQWHVSNLFFFIPCRICCKKSKGHICIVFILHQMKEYPFRHPEILTSLFQKHLYGSFIASKLRSKHICQLHILQSKPGAVDVLDTQTERDRPLKLFKGFIRELHPSPFSGDLQIRL